VVALGGHGTPPRGWSWPGSEPRDDLGLSDLGHDNLGHDDLGHDDLGHDNLGDFCYSTGMTTEPVQYRIRGSSAASIVASVERGVSSGGLAPGETVPSVRALARELEVSPTTVASAYRDLRQRGVLVTHDRSRTVIGHRPPVASRLAPAVPAGVVDLATGNPDHTLLPDLEPALRTLTAVQRLYGGGAGVDALVELARTGFDADGVPADQLAVVAGGLDGIERVLEVHLRVGDRIGIEDPGYIGSVDLARALGLVPVPVPIDDEGPTVDGLAEALEGGIHALLVTPRAQNPTGAAIGPQRAAALRRVLADHPEVLVVEDDHASLLVGVDHHPLSAARERWAVVRSVAKALGPDLRTAVLAGDEETVARVLGRQRLGTGWVSHLLQQLTATVSMQARTDGTLLRARATYGERRDALLAALQERGIGAHGRTGLNVWIPVPEEVPVVQGLLARGWAVQAGEPFRLVSPPGIRVTVSELPASRAGELAGDLAEVLDQRLGTRRG
jgi:DNA-binding transcriptional MocR family regulator